MVNLKRNKEEESKGQFLSEFKQYLANKKRLQSGTKEPESPTKGQHLSSTLQNNSLAKSQNFNESQLHLKNKSLLNNSNSSNFFSQPQPSPEEELVKKIFKSIQAKRNKKLNQSKPH